jgi:hypothetical protein
MSIGLSGIAIFFFAFILFVFFILGLIITSIILIVQKNRTQKVFRELKGARVFLANIFTGIFLLILMLFLWHVKSFDFFLNHSKWFFIIVLGFYFLPFFFFIQLFKKVGRQK